jgi:hypothetical protein
LSSPPLSGQRRLLWASFSPRVKRHQNSVASLRRSRRSRSRTRGARGSADGMRTSAPPAGPRSGPPRPAPTARLREPAEKTSGRTTHSDTRSSAIGQVAGAATEKHRLAAHRPNRPALTAFSQESPCPDRRTWPRRSLPDVAAPRIFTDPEECRFASPLRRRRVAAADVLHGVVLLGGDHQGLARPDRSRRLPFDLVLQRPLEDIDDLFAGMPMLDEGRSGLIPTRF